MNIESIRHEYSPIFNEDEVNEFLLIDQYVVEKDVLFQEGSEYIIEMYMKYSLTGPEFEFELLRMKAFYAKKKLNLTIDINHYLLYKVIEKQKLLNVPHQDFSSICPYKSNKNITGGKCPFLNGN
jgi:hypothetical protein